MKSKILTMLCVLTVCTGGAFANMVVNGSFENPSPEGWTGGFNTYNMTQPYYDGPAIVGTGDKYGWRPGGDGTTNGCGPSIQVIDLTGSEGVPFTFSAWLAGYSNDYGFLRLTFNDAADGSGAAVGTPIEFNPYVGGENPFPPLYWKGSANDDGQADVTVDHTQRNWSFFKTDGTVPSGTLSAVLEWEGHNGGAIGSGSAGNDAYADDIVFELLGDVAAVVSPADGQTAVPVTTDAVAETPDAIVDTTLVWGSPVTYTGATYNIYFGKTEPNYLESDYGLTLLNTGGPTSDTAIDPSPSSDLEYGTWYYWVVDSYEPNLVGTQVPALYRGLPWSFKTVVADPVPDQQPQDTAAFPTESASFTATASSLTTLNYQWKKVAAGGDVDVPGATDSTLIISDVELADEGYYYCEFINDSGNPVNSDSALLTVKRRLVHLPLDGDTLAGVGTTIDGVGNGDLEWVTGISGSAANLTQDNADPNILDYIKLADDVNDLHFADRTDFTVSVWVKGNYASGEGEDVAIISNKDWNSGSNQGWLVGNGYGNGRANWNWKAADGPRRGYGLPDEEGNYINDGQWHHILVSHDRDGNADFYFDGALKNQTDIAGDGDIDAGFPTVIGTDGAEGSEWHYGFIGSVDEVEIWNYTMNPTDVATMYTDLAGGWVCVNRPALDTTGPDGVPDCKVDLFELLQIANAWLECGRIPDSECN